MWMRPEAVNHSPLARRFTYPNKKGRVLCLAFINSGCKTAVIGY